jgi:hypothetical protein
MDQLWEASFKVDGICKWNFKAGSKREAEEKAIAKFRDDPYWSPRYPETPPFEVRQVPGPAAAVPHGDVAGPSS